MSAVWSNWLKRLSLGRRKPITSRRNARPQCWQLEARETPDSGFSGGINVALGSAGVVAGAGPGGVPLIAVHNPTTGAMRASFLAFEQAFSGGVHVATAGNFIAAGAGQGGAPLVRIFDAAGNPVAALLAFDAAFSGGVRVALADVSGDGNVDIICAGGPGGAAQVRVFNGTNLQLLREFMAFPMGFNGGVSISAADLNGDGRAEIVAGAGQGGMPMVAVFDGATGAQTNTFMAFPTGFNGGVTVSATSLGGGRIVVGASAGGAPVMAIFNAAGAQQQSLLGFDAGFTGGMFVGAADVNGDGTPDVAVGAGPGGSPVVRVFNGATVQSFADFFAFEGPRDTTPPIVPPPPTPDTVAPSITFISPPPGGSFPNNVTISGRATDNVGVTLLEADQGNGAGFQPVTVDANGNFTFTTTYPAGTQGARTVNFRARDAAGNISNLVPFNFTLTTPDTTAPVVTITRPPQNQTFTTNPEIGGTVTDNVAVTLLEARVDGGAFQAVTFNATTGEWEFTPALPTDGTANGQHTVDFRARDAAGNTSVIVTFNFTLNATPDTTAPVIALINSPDGQTVATNPTLTGTVTDSGSGVMLLEIRVDGGAFMSVAFNDVTGSFNFTTMFALDGTDDGLHTIDIRATDVAGNASALTTISFTLDTVPDTTAPVVMVTTPSGQTFQNNPTIQGTVTDDTGVMTLEAQIDGGAFQTVTFDPVTGAFSFTTNLPLDGTALGNHTVTFRATDTSGNVSTLVDFTFTLEADTTAPVITVTTQSGQTFQNNPTIEGTVTDNAGVTVFEASLDGGAFTAVTFDPVTGAFSFTTNLPLDGTALGNHTVQFRATDAAGNVTTSDFTFTLEADTTAPVVTVTTQSGQTFQNNPTIEGTVTDNVGVTVFEASLDGGAFTAVTFDPVTGAFSFTTNLPLDGTALGNHTVQFRATDAAGNVTTSDFTFTLEADTTAPVVTVTTQSGQTFQTNPRIEGTVTDNVGVTVFEASVDGGAFAAVTFDPVTGAFSFTTNLPVDGSAAGPHTVQFRATDAAGNVTTSDFTFTLEDDVTAPVITVTTQSGQTFQNNPTITGTVTDNVAVTVFEASVDGGAFTAVTFDPVTGAFSFTTNLPLDGTALGNHTVQFRATDAGGNITTSDFTFTLEADTTAPVVTVTTANDQTFQNNPTIQGTVTDNVGVTSLQASVDGGAFVAVTFDPVTGAFSFTTNLPLDGSALGPHTVQFRASDAAGNVSTLVDFNFILAADTTAPVVTVTTPTGQSFATNPAIAGTVMDNVGVTMFEASVDGGAFVTVTFDGLTGAFTFTTALPTDGSADGPHTVQFRVTDAAGNVTTSDFTFTLDTVAPVVTITNPAPNQTFPTNVTVQGNTTDVQGVVSLEFNIDGGAFMPVIFSPQTGDFGFTTNLPTDGSADGPHTIQVRATDAAGNVTTESITFTLSTNQTAPVVTITNPAPNQTFPTNVTIQGTATDDLAVVTLEMSVDGGAFTAVTFDPQTGAFGFTTTLAIDGSADGPHTIVVRATDAGGNVTTESITFTLDTTVPVLTITSPPPNQPFNTNVTVQGVATDVQGLATVEFRVDGGAFQTVTVDPQTGAYSFTTNLPTDGSADGPHLVEVRATDRAGNFSLQSVTFTLDTTAPIVTIATPGDNMTFPTNVTVLGTTSDNRAVVSLQYRIDGGAWIDILFDPLTGAWGFTTNLPTDGSADGPHTIEVRAMDAAGNMFSAFLTFTLDVP